MTDLLVCDINHFIDGRLALSYVWFKIILTAYVSFAYIINHVDYGLQKLSPCSSTNHSSNLSFMDITTNISNHGHSKLHSRWPFYWMYFDNWCFSIFTLCLIVDTSLVIRRYIKENKKFATAKELEIWYIIQFIKFC